MSRTKGTGSLKRDATPITPVQWWCGAGDTHGMWRRKTGVKGNDGGLLRFLVVSVLRLHVVFILLFLIFCRAIAKATKTEYQLARVLLARHEQKYSSASLSVVMVKMKVKWSPSEIATSDAASFLELLASSCYAWLVNSCSVRVQVLPGRSCNSFPMLSSMWPSPPPLSSAIFVCLQPQTLLLLRTQQQPYKNVRCSASWR